MTQAAFSGHTLAFGYDQLSRNTSAGGPHGTVSYQYDLAGRRTRVTWPDAFYAQYDYDLTGAVTAIRENGAGSGVGVLAEYAYDNLGRRTSIARGNGVSTAYEYDAAGRLEELAHELASTANDVSFAYAHNAAGQQIERERTATNSAYVWPQPANSVQLPTANGLNQIAQIGGTSFSYDGRGNLTSDGTTTYAYDVYNRLTSAAGQTYGYDPAGRLYQTSGSTSTRRFLYDSADRIAEYNSSGTMVRRFVHGPGLDEPVLWYEGAGTATRRWYIQDELGSVIALANSSGAASYINSYDEYGRPAAANNIASRFQYTGQIWLEGGVYHYKARAYAPHLGRFLQTDPILYAGGMNLYAYVGNDPVNLVDPSGLQRQPHVDGGGGGDSWDIVVIGQPGGGITPGASSANNFASLLHLGNLNVSFTVSDTNVLLTTPEVLGEEIVVRPPPRLSAWGPLVFAGALLWQPHAFDRCGMGDMNYCNATGRPYRESRPKGLPPGTVPIDQTDLTREQIHRIKREIGAGPRDWVGVSPDGRIWISDPTTGQPVFVGWSHD